METLKSQILSHINHQPGVTRADLLREFPNVQGNTMSATLNTLYRNGELDRELVPNKHQGKQSRWSEVNAFFPKSKRNGHDRTQSQKQESTKSRNIAGFTIEAGIPLPGDARLGRNAKYPFRAMKVGESFVGDAKARASAAKALATEGRKFISRRISEGKFRIWRTK